MHKVRYKVVGIRFKKAGKIYFFNPVKLALKVADDVIVETTRGIEYGQVLLAAQEVTEDQIVPPLKKVLRKVTRADREQLKNNHERVKFAQQVCLEKIALHALPMKLIKVEQTFDGGKITFYFTADGRIDFRELVKDLATVFRTRIELRQIGVRDEAKMLGGLGCCGRELCCASWLADFVPVSIRMAKEQNLSLNPTKISGICGRLMCCLKYENETYEEAKKQFPEIGALLETPGGTGWVKSCNIFRNTITVELQETKESTEFALSEIKVKK